MKLNINSIIMYFLSLAFTLSPIAVSAYTPLTAACAGLPLLSSGITWTASSSGGVLPVTFLWGNGNTSVSQTVSAVTGIYTMTLIATDASSTVATATCTATVPQVSQSVPTITSFTATPSIITADQSSLLSWNVSNASSTTISNGIGIVTGTAVTVTPGITTNYQLSAVNPSGTAKANVTVTVNATSTNSSIQTLIQNIVNQIASLRAQLVQLIAQQTSNSDTATTTPSGTPSPAACFNFSRDLTMGHKGDDVVQLQRFLAQDKTLFASSSVTGYFGPMTAKALQKYQKKYGIYSVGSTTTGYFGPKTRKFFENHCLNDLNTSNHQDNEND